MRHDCISPDKQLIISRREAKAIPALPAEDRVFCPILDEIYSE